MKLKFLLIPAAFSISTAVIANPYIGASIGGADYDIDGYDQPDTFEVKIGNRFNDYFAAEISYINFGDAEGDVWQVSTDSVAVGGLLIAPVGDKVDLYVKVGVHNWDTQFRQRGIGKIDEDTGTSAFYGVGAKVRVVDAVELGASYTQYEAHDVNIRFPALTLNIIFK